MAAWWPRIITTGRAVATPTPRHQASAPAASCLPPKLNRSQSSKPYPPQPMCMYLQRQRSKAICLFIVAAHLVPISGRPQGKLRMYARRAGNGASAKPDTRTPKHSRGDGARRRTARAEHLRRFPIIRTVGGPRKVQSTQHASKHAGWLRLPSLSRPGDAVNRELALSAHVHS